MVVMVSSLIAQNLDLQDDTQLQGRYKGRDYVLEMTQFYGSILYLPKNKIAGEVGNTNLSEILDRGKIKSTRYRTRPKNGDIRCPSMEVEFLDDDVCSISYYAHDEGFVQARVIFDDFEVCDKDGVCTKADEYLEFSSNVISNYLTTLRYLSNSNVLKTFSNDLTPGNRIYAALDNPQATLFECPQLTCVSNQLNFGNREGFEPYFVRTRDYGVAQFIESGREVPIADQMLLEAKNLAFHARCYDAAIMMIQSSFELYIGSKFRGDCELQGISKLYASTENKKRISYKRVLERASIGRLLGVIAEQIYGIAFDSGEKYEAWHKQCYEKRNAIAHKGKLGFGFDDVGEAFVSVTEYRSYIEEMIALRLHN